tara:strand:+ start:202 stop:960 length:759 start_codon:yes stop_codon:yes gene_type:complete
MSKISEKKVALVTGSSRGIGLSIAKELDKSGIKVLINSRKKIKKNIFRNFINKPDHYMFDVTSLKQTEKCFKKIKKKYKKLDYLICNAGYSSSPKKKEFDIIEWKNIFERNFFSTLNSVFVYRKLFKNNNKKKIICISSVSGSYVSAAPSTYAIAKSALNNFVKHVSKSLTKENIILNCVSPGNIFFKGGIWDKNFTKNKKHYLKYIKKEVPENRLGKPHEIANLVSYLCSEKSTFINGSVIKIDGGQDKSL